MDDKQLLRSRVRAARASRDADHIERVGEALTRHALVQWPGLRVMAAYASVGDEPPTRGLLDAVGATGTRVLLPRVVDRMLEWVEYAGWDGLVVGARELLEPVGDSVPSGVHDVDLMLVPALAVDRTGNRLGRGGGYYDRLLATLGSAAVAVVFDDEVLPAVPVEPHDRPVHAALTPSGLVTFQA